MLENVRSYEVSIWTLQDGFITVLKPSNVESQGIIQDTDFVLKDDGENTFSFKIPMYIQELDESQKEPALIQKENPIWYNTRNGTIIASMRKIKVIFNKATQEEKVFEFIINKVSESHEGYKKYCQVECSGLAFNELGKQGYTIALEGEFTIRDAIEKWEKGGRIGDKPINNINFWADKVFANSNWTYEIRMDWSAYNLDNAESNKIYEEPYVSKWIKEGGKLVPAETTPAREKLAIIEAKESNRYNLSQTIAETFQVFCRYEYEYDDNYHIIGRKVIFYNNFLNEKDGIIDFTFKYNTKSLKREMDSTDLCSKMFVSPLNDADRLTGEVRLSDCGANKSLEDYLLNFEYLYGIGTITKEQYDAIKEYEIELYDKNTALINYSKRIADLQERLNSLKAKVENAEDSYKSAEETAAWYREKKLSLAQNEQGTVEITNVNPLICGLIKKVDNSISYYDFKLIGVIPATIQLYQNFNASTKQLSNKIYNFSVIQDEYHYAKRLELSSNITGTIYATLQYYPALYYDQVIKTYEGIRDRDFNFYDKYNEEADPGTQSYDTIKTLNIKLEDAEEIYNTLLEEKQSIINKFERLMGPALREGTWQPEDEYSKYEENVSVNTTIGISSPREELTFYWDTEVFDDEQKNYYEYGANRKKIYYPCIELNSHAIEVLQEKDLDTLALIYDDKFLYKDQNGEIKIVEDTSSYQQKFFYPCFFGSEVQLCYLKKFTGDIVPALLFTRAEKLSDDFLEYLGTKTEANFRIAEKINSNTFQDTSISINWIISPSDVVSNTNIQPPQMVYPRFKISTDRVKSPSTTLTIKVNNNELSNYEDFYIIQRAEDTYVTLRPEVLIKNGDTYNISYYLSTAAEAIYLDAVKILKENAYPKVSYTLEPIAIDKTFIHTAYARLGQIAHINDYELAFENVMGYISELNLDLNKPWEDKVVIKNYKTKFEDLFSTIVAQTEQMKKNAYVIGMASDAFNSDGTLSNILVNNIEQRINEPEKVITPVEAYKQYEPFIRNELAQAFDEAGVVIALAKASVSDVNNLIIKNAGILKAFKETIKDSLESAMIDINQQEGYINIWTSDHQTKDTSVLKIDKENGIYIGSDREINFYSGPVNVAGSKSSAKISKDRILFGVSDGTQGTAVDLNKDRIIFGASVLDTTTGELTSLPENTGTKEGTAGVFISKEEIRLATENSSGNARSYIGMDGNGIVIAKANSDESGAIIKLNNSGVLIGTAPESGETSRYITAIQNGTSTMSGYEGAKFQVYAPNFVVDENGHLYAYEADIAGKITATSGKIANWNIKGGILYNNIGSADAEGYVRYCHIAAKVNGSDYFLIGGGRVKYDANGQVIDARLTDAPFYVTQAGELHATNAYITGEITATRLTLSGEATIPYSKLDNVPPQINYISAYFDESGQLKKGNPTEGNNGFKVDTNGLLTASNAMIYGTIYASAGKIANWNIRGGILYNHTGTIDGDGYYPYSHMAAQTNGSSYFLVASGKVKYNADGTVADAKLQEAPFYVRHTGELHATNAHITGEIIATSGKIANWILGDGNNNTYANWLYADVSRNSEKSTVYPGKPKYITGINMDLNNNEYPAFAANLDVDTGIATFQVRQDGLLYASKGTIGGWHIGTPYTSNEDWNGSYYIYSWEQGTEEDSNGVMQDVNYYSGMSCNSLDLANTPTFFAGAKIVNNQMIQPNFSVSSSGELYSSGATIVGKVKFSRHPASSKRYSIILADNWAEIAFSNILRSVHDDSDILWIQPTTSTGTTFSLSQGGTSINYLNYNCNVHYLKRQ